MKNNIQTFTNQRITSLDLLRGIAACAVVLFHYTIEESVHLSDGNFLRSMGRYGHYGVEVFFVISGFVIPWSMFKAGFKLEYLGRFLLRRCIRIEIPYFSIIILEILLIYISSLTPWRTGVSERLEFQNIMMHIGYLNGLLGEPWLLPVFWTLAIEFQFYLLIALVYGLLTHHRKLWKIGAVACLVGSSFLINQPYLFFHYSLYFVVGILLFQHKAKIIKPGEYFLSSVIVMAGIVVQGGWLPATICLGAVVVIHNFKQEWRWAKLLGMISYSIYLIHIPFGGRLLFLTQKFVHDEHLKSLLIILYLFMTLCVAWLFYKFIERPSLILSKSINYKDKTTRKLILSNN